jgi:hypothetical protein
MMLNDVDNARSCFEKAANKKPEGKWAVMIQKFALKFLKTGGHFAALELLFITGLIDKLLNTGTNQHKVTVFIFLYLVITSRDQLDLLHNVEDLGQRVGCLTPIAKGDIEAHKKSMLSYLSFGYYGRETTNDPKVDNRYLLIELNAS